MPAILYPYLPEGRPVYLNCMQFVCGNIHRRAIGRGNAMSSKNFENILSFKTKIETRSTPNNKIGGNFHKHSTW